ncbi:hypothetical protein [Agrobacterium sp. M50-1]|uniref:hypothetical protein n=1 Tax=Agrobacterium sp. M50-1 TaxID=3132821 RepID=UPI003CE5A601
MDTDSEFHCLVPFTDESESFVNGFEAGMIWQRMLSGDELIGGATEPPTHSENIEVFKRMAQAMGYDLDGHYDRTDGWMYVSFIKRKRKFSIVQGGISDDGQS